MLIIHSKFEIYSKLGITESIFLGVWAICFGSVNLKAAYSFASLRVAALVVKV